MTPEDYKRLQDELEEKQGETPEQAKTEAYKALIRMLNYMAAQLPAEAYKEVVEQITGGDYQVRFTICLPATTIEMAAELIELKTGKVKPLFIIGGGSETEH